ncbi:MAG TPA: MarR family transcriptional regulator [Dictyobacter sp.]|jgi:DNA-binding MarR family transcriptional regulator|nr:MarR family transcriptional regulator [Dictyobacter sp.]
MEFTLRNLPRHQVLWDIAHKIPDVDILSVESYLLFLRVASDVLMALQEHLDRYELSDGKLAVLMTLHAAPEGRMIPSQIAESMGVTRSTMTGLIAGLERLELVSRQSDEEDGRIAAISLTPRGQDLLASLLPHHFSHIQELMKQLNEGDKQNLIALLEKIALGIPTLREP